jgi:CRP/FNR family transcriptional regulator, cyclic AMP receptor protein
MTVLAAPPEGLGESLCMLIRTDRLPASTVNLARREVVRRRLDGERCVYVVERGHVKAVVASREGKECLVGIYTPGDVFGECSLFGAEPTETVTAMSPSTLRRIMSSRVIAALADDRLRDDFVRYLARRLAEQQKLITELVTADSEHRLAAVLLHLGRKLGRREANLLRIEERITQGELASMVGTTRSRVGYFLKRFHHTELVAQSKGCFLVIDEDRLEDYLAGDMRTRRPYPVRVPAVATR